MRSEDFASGFRAGVEAAARMAESCAPSPEPNTVDTRVIHQMRMAADIARYIRALQPPQQPDAAPSDFVATMRKIRSELTAAGITVDAAAFARERNLDPAVAAWRALSDDQRLFVFDCLSPSALVHVEFRDAMRAAGALLRSLAPEAGDDR